MTKFRIFVQDVGRSGYSGYKDVEAGSASAAVHKIAPRGVCPCCGLQLRGGVHPHLIAVPHSRKDLWPDWQTGRVPQEALNYA